VQVIAVLILDPSVRAARDEAVEIRDKQDSRGRQDARHLSQCRAEVRDVDQRQIAYDKIETGVRKGQAFGSCDLIFALRVASPCRREQLLRRVDSDSMDASRLQHPAKPSLTAAHVEGARELPRRDALEHDRIKHVFSAPVAPFAHCGDPGTRRKVPTIVHEECSDRSQPCDRCY